MQLIIERYQQRINDYKQKFSRIQQRIYCIGTIRLLLFIMGIVGAIYLRHEG